MEASQTDPSARDARPLLDVHQVAAILRCSVRTVQRLSRSGAIPRPLRVAALSRWRRVDIDDWIASSRVALVGRRTGKATGRVQSSPRCGASS
jgi:predicted DNA-binding transcriptional regulator AlpA